MARGVWWVARVAPLVFVVALAGAAAAKPPKSSGFIRLDELEASLDARLKELRAQEEFEKKPVEERLVILLRRGVKRYRERDVTGERVVDEVFRWKELTEESPTPAARRAVGLLPEALDSYFKAYLTSKALRLERYRASKTLVDALCDHHAHVRAAAIACLKAMYGTDRGYDPNGSKSDLRRAMKKWKKAIRP